MAMLPSDCSQIEQFAHIKRIPHLDFDERKKIVTKLKYVDNVVPQDSLDHTYNLKKYKPDFVVHGDDWKTGILKKTKPSNKNF